MDRQTVPWKNNTVFDTTVSPGPWYDLLMLTWDLETYTSISGFWLEIIDTYVFCSGVKESRRSVC